MQLEVINSITQESVCTLTGVSGSWTILQIKREIYSNCKNFHPDRQSLRLDPKGTNLKDEDTLDKCGFKGQRIYLKDLGLQIGWTTVFLSEYAGPFIIYLIFYTRPWIFYGVVPDTSVMSTTAHLAAICWVCHFGRRLLETLFVHRFSHATMPIFNLFKNCSFYWFFSGYISYHVSHPLYTPPSSLLVCLGLVGFVLSELGNLSIHLALRDLRPPGTKKRSIPMPTSNPYTGLFDLVSCPHYTYEFIAWLSFTIMTYCLPAALFTLFGLYQMTVWALAKQKNYRKEFPNYPKTRKSIIPFII